MPDKLMLYQQNATECREMARRAKSELKGHYEKMAQTWEMRASWILKNNRDTNDG